VVRGVSFDLFEGETLAVVGGSGCGKTSLARGLLGLANILSGRIEVDGVTLGQRKGRLMRHPAIQVVFQDPYASMNPRMVVSSILEEGLRALLPELSAVARNLRILECLEAVGLDATVLERYPHEFSGGQRQRLCIARSLLLRPKVLILDEPTSALDVTVQAQVLGLLKSLRSRFGLSYLFITHDLGVVAQMADRVAVMHQGAVVEMGQTRGILMAPRHAVTQHLIEAMPEILKSIPQAHLLLVGEGPYREHLQTLVKKHNLEASVSFIGRIQYKDLPTYICVGDIFAMPSRSRLMGLEVEGLGIVYLEASSCGLPVLAGDSGGAPDALVQNETGLVVNGTDDQQIATAAIKLLTNIELSKKMGLAGRQWIIDNWRWEIWSKDFEKLLNK
jgi:ABC-type dipeptide/oligopeptide/nickel transport system ATPase subunit